MQENTDEVVQYFLNFSNVRMNCEFHRTPYLSTHSYLVLPVPGFPRIHTTRHFIIMTSCIVDILDYLCFYHKLNQYPFNARTFRPSVRSVLSTAIQEYLDKCEATSNECEREGPKLMTAGNQNYTDIQGQKNEVDGTGIPGIIKIPFRDELMNPYGVLQ